jgi:hypothetical protein
LAAALAATGRFEASVYTSQSWNAFALARGEASQQVDSPVSQSSVDQALSALHSATAGLVLAIRTAELASVLAVVDALAPNQRDYTAESWAPFAAARTAARSALGRLESQAGINRALAALRAGLDALVLAPPPDQPAIPVPQPSTDQSPRAGGDAPPATTAPSDNGPGVAPVAVKVKASQATIRLARGKSATLAAYGYAADGSAIKATWKSSKPSVAAVSASGKVTAKRVGKATITIAAAGKTAKIRVTVVSAAKAAKAKVSKVKVAHAPKSLAVGKAAYLSASTVPAAAAGAKITYASSKPAVAAVDKAGRLRAVAPGKAVIQVKAGGKSTKFTVTVK